MDFRQLHDEGTFVIPNPRPPTPPATLTASASPTRLDSRGSARILASLGFPALATTSAGLANSRDLMDMAIDRDILLAHVADLAPATDLPLHVDAERCFADDPAGVAETVRLLGEAGAAGCSIEDWDPAADAITPLPEAVARVEAAAGAAADAGGMVLTARCEHHLHGVDDLDATIERLIAYRDAGAEVVYAPGLFDADQTARIVSETATAVNCILFPGGLSVAEMAEAGVRRVSLGSGLSTAAYGAVAQGARHVLDHGVPDPGLPRLCHRDAAAAFGSSS